MNKSGWRWIWWLLSGLVATALIGYGFSLASLLWTSYKLQLFSLHFCLTDGCLKYWLESVPNALAVAKATSDFLVAVATTGGIIVALMSYVSSVSNSAITNHISHYSVFQSYVSNEIHKRRRIDPSAVDTFLWYNLIFPQSRDGSIKISLEYRNLVLALGACICESNAQAQYAAEGSFRFKPHQSKIIEQLKKFGIALEHQPRNDFYEIEDQVISLVDSVNKSFCFSHTIPMIDKRLYV
ncbi:hypothetical protein P3T18_001953 [Paraburkholderia sp. GAS199]|uniref:retron Ec48 family effector membrane protein n=1 Tax=Paraburkholderia sp. GAS199 TaxID=3035126 RepID=UPI003D22E2DC